MLNLPVAAGSKKRLGDDRVVIDALVGDVAGKNVIILDDEIANGGTILEVLQKLRERGVKQIVVACTHGLFAGKAISRLAAQPDIFEIVTTDTVPVLADKRLPNMTVLSVAPLLAEAIRRIHVGESVSDLFDA
jgi:ribose-phosphate pyrophosphokinase